MNIVPAFLRHRIAHRPNLVRIVDNAVWLFYDKLLRSGVGLIVGVWIARYLGPEQYGLLSFATAFVGLFGAIAGLGLQGIVVRDIVRDPTSKEETLGTAAFLQIVGGLTAYALMHVSIIWLRPDVALAKVLVAILGSMTLFKASEVVVYWFESQVLSKYYVWVRNSSFLIFAAIKVGLIINNAPLIAFAWAIMSEGLMVAISLGVMFELRGPRLHRLCITFMRMKSLLKDCWPLLLSSVAVIIYLKIDQIMLGQMVGDEAVGIYSAAVLISEAWYFIPVIIVTSIFPSILEMKKRNEAQYYQRLQRLFDLMVLLSIGVALPMTFLSTPIAVIFFGEAFATSGTVLAIHIWAAVFVFMGVASSKWFLAENRQILGFKRTALGAVVNIILNFLLIPSLGVIGSAIATVISYAVADFLSDLVHVETRQIFYMKVSALNLFAALGRLRMM